MKLTTTALERHQITSVCVAIVLDSVQTKKVDKQTW